MAQYSEAALYQLMFSNRTGLAGLSSNFYRYLRKASADSDGQLIDAQSIDWDVYIHTEE